MRVDDVAGNIWQAVAGGGVYELCLERGEWTRHATGGWPQPNAGHMVGCNTSSLCLTECP